MKKFKFILTSFVMMLSLAAVTLVSSPAYAQFNDTKHAACLGVSAAGQACNDDGGGITKLIGAAINILSIVVGVAAVIMIIVSGLRYVTSGGDSSSVAGAKRSLLYAVIGIVITASAQFIVRFVLGKL